MPRKIIGLLTDFGADNHYVSQMKGRILGIHSDVEIVDITHSITPQNVQQAAFILADCVDAFPPQTHFVVVVDPGVGTARQVIVAKINQRIYVMPDNGLVTELANRHPVDEAYRIHDSDFSSASRTFHGRDIMAPVAAEISVGVPILKFAEKIEPESLIKIDLPKPQLSDSTIEGEILFADCFGNLISNVNASLLPAQKSDCVVELADQQIRGVQETFADVAAGQLVCLAGSNGQLEIAVNQGHAARKLGVNSGASLRITW